MAILHTDKADYLIPGQPADGLAVCGAVMPDEPPSIPLEPCGPCRDARPDLETAFYGTWLVVSGHLDHAEELKEMVMSLDLIDGEDLDGLLDRWLGLDAVWETYGNIVDEAQCWQAGYRYAVDAARGGRAVEALPGSANSCLGSASTIAEATAFWTGAFQARGREDDTERFLL